MTDPQTGAARGGEKLGDMICRADAIEAVRNRRDCGGGSASYRQACNHIIEALANQHPATDGNTRTPPTAPVVDHIGEGVVPAVQADLREEIARIIDSFAWEKMEPREDPSQLYLNQRQNALIRADAILALHRLSATSEHAAGMREALELFQSFGCPRCSGDCGSANPPVSICPMQIARDALKVREALEPTRAWAVTMANMRQGQSDTPRCEPPSEADVQWAFDRIKEACAAYNALAALNTQERPK